MNELDPQSKNHLPLLSNQKRLWILSQQDNTNPAYNLQLTYHIKMELNYDLLNESIRLLFSSQPLIFSVFKQKEGIPYIEIVNRALNVELIDFSHLPAESRADKIISFAGEESRKCFDIENGPLYRLFLYKENEESFYFQAIIHHLVFDGWSMRIFVNELSRIYTNLSHGLYENQKPFVYQSHVFEKVEDASELRKNEKSLIEFWKENLKGCPSEFKFPFDFPRKNVMTGFGHREPVYISHACTTKLKELSKKANSSLFKTMLSVIGILMQKYSGEDDICIGFPVSTRHDQTSFDEIFGFFVRTTLARLNTNWDSGFIQYLSYTRDVVAKAIENSNLPFDKIIEAVNPERRLNMNPLFQVSLSWWNKVVVPMDLDGNLCERVLIPEGVSPFDISFYLWETDDHIEGKIEYSKDLLKHETVVRLRNNFLNLINKLVENPETSIKSISLITDEEKMMIDGLNDTHTSYPKDKTIIQLFEEQVLLYSDKTAVAFKEQKLTYKQLNSKANQLAHSIMEKGVGRNTPVGILAEKSLDVMVGILGILKAGGVYVPIDPDYPKQRIDFIISDSGCRFLLTQEKYMNLAVENVVKLNLNSPDSFHINRINVENINTPSDLAYIMYTSGTTGNPKGSMINQFSIVRLVRNTNYIDISSEDRILLTSAIVFDVATFEIWGALLNGGSLYIAEKETILNPKTLGEELAKNKISILWLTSALFTHIAESRTDIFGNLKYLLVGGDVLSAPHINKVRKSNPGLKVINGYGPTENTTFSTTYLIEQDFDFNIPIGKPISNSTAYIFDKNMNYQPIGVIGELYVGGDGVSKGYINRDDLNKKSFMDHPYIPGERIYKTGDYAKWLPDGNIEFHGRVDNQLKIRGFRVELEEIESVISKIEGVVETVIKPVKVNEGDYKLIAYLNVQVTFKMDSKEISRQIKSKLPPYMVPSAYKFMQGFPRTINGKIDRKALSFDLKELENKEGMDIKTMTPTEEAIYKIWSEALKTKEISVTDNFFDIGGNSLMAISIMSKIESAFNIYLGLRLFFDSPLIKNIGEMIDIKIESFDTKKTVKKKLNTDPKIIKGEI